LQWHLFGPVLEGALSAEGTGIVTDFEPVITTDDLMIYAEELKPGDRSVYHGGLTVIAVRESQRRPDVVEVDFEDDDGNRHDTHYLLHTEWCHIVRPVLVDADTLDAELDAIDELDDDHQDDDRF
jgi:hypothetical protein